MSKLLGMCSLIVWDEVVMANKNMLLVVDITLRDLLSANEFMGGISFVCAGDFRQILPVVKEGGSNQEISATIKNTYFWEELRKYALTENLRLRGPDEHRHNKIFAERLLQIGHAASGPFAIPENFGVVYYDQKEFINSVYQDLIDHVGDHRYFSSRVIISPLNVDVTEINKAIQNMLPGTKKVYLSEDKMESDDDVDYQISTLNEINPASLPVHCLELKIGSVVMVIRNISPPRICNDTRVIVDNLKKNIIVGRILGGVYDGEQITIFRIKLVSSDSPVNFSRFQFPVKLSFAMTINKSQGHTIQKCGLYLYGTKCFSHGQLYLACSRVTSWDTLNIYLKPLKKDEIPTLENVLYPEVFNELETVKEEYSRLDSRVLIRQEDVEEDNELMRIYIPRSGGLSKEEINAFFVPEISSEDFEDVKERLEEIEEVEEKP
ncbi:ATP-dependent DNA helicase Pif1-like [Oratosquilla oratoria]|uniref:ATP-dependent DNA helicase Pif1-like n=1 Tax=Oratosquilla oratoria TaxID=337810 RepID=UPI003F764BC3